MKKLRKVFQLQLVPSANSRGNNRNNNRSSNSKSNNSRRKQRQEQQEQQSLEEDTTSGDDNKQVRQSVYQQVITKEQQRPLLSPVSSTNKGNNKKKNRKNKTVFGHEDDGGDDDNANGTVATAGPPQPQPPEGTTGTNIVNRHCLASQLEASSSTCTESDLKNIRQVPNMDVVVLSPVKKKKKQITKKKKKTINEQNRMMKQLSLQEVEADDDASSLPAPSSVSNITNNTFVLVALVEEEEGGEVKDGDDHNEKVPNVDIDGVEVMMENNNKKNGNDRWNHDRDDNDVCSFERLWEEDEEDDSEEMLVGGEKVINQQGSDDPNVIIGDDANDKKKEAVNESHQPSSTMRSFNNKSSHRVVFHMDHHSQKTITSRICGNTTENTSEMMYIAEKDGDADEICNQRISLSNDDDDDEPSIHNFACYATEPSNVTEDSCTDDDVSALTNAMNISSAVPSVVGNSGLEKFVEAKRLATIKLQTGLQNMFLHESSLQTMSKMQQSDLEKEVESIRCQLISQRKENDNLRQQNQNLQLQLSDAVQKQLQLTEEHYLMLEQNEFRKENECVLHTVQENNALTPSSDVEELAHEDRHIVAYSLERHVIHSDHLNQELEDQRMKNAKLEEQLHEAQQETDHQGARRKEVEEEVKAAHCELADMGMELEKLYKEAERQKECCFELDTTKEELHEANGKLKKMEMLLSEEIESLKAARADDEVTLDVASEEIIGNEQMIQDLTIWLSERDSIIEEYKKENHRKERTIKILTRSLGEKDLAIETLKIELGREIEILFEEIDTLKEECEETAKT